jgi:histidine triad (HIT) family protein
MTKSIFSKIIAGEIPSFKVYEDKKVVAILDINPINAGHILVIPRKEYITLMDMPDKLAEHTITVIKHLASEIQRITGAPGINIFLNNGVAAGQEVPHVHFHIIPRFEGDEAIPHWKRKQVSLEDLKELSELFSKSIRTKKKLSKPTKTKISKVKLTKNFKN